MGSRTSGLTPNPVSRGPSFASLGKEKKKNSLREKGPGSYSSLFVTH